MKNLITITTDFGDQFAASQLRAVMASLGFEGHVVENHSVTPFAISEGAFEILQLAKFSKNGAVHVGVIDPGVGTSRFGIVIKTHKSFFVGPNNGLLYPTAQEERIVNVWKLDEAWFGNTVCNTFHGRDVFIKAAVFLAQGKIPEEFGCNQITQDLLEKREFLDGEIVHIDAYGNYKIYWRRPLTIGTILQVKTSQGVLEIPIVKTFDNVPPKAPLAFLGSHNTLELAINLGNAQEFFQFKLGQTLPIINLY